jgi:hypothetical protein
VERQDIRRAERRSQAGHAIGILGIFLAIFVMMVNLPVGLLMFAAAAVVGWKLADGSRDPQTPSPR